MDNNYFLGFVVVIREMMKACFTRRLLPARKRGKRIPDLGSVHGRWIVPAVVAARHLVHGEVVAAASRAKELLGFVAGFKLFEVVEDGKRHSAAEGEAPSIMTVLATSCKQSA